MLGAALATLQEMRDNEISADVVTLNILLSACKRAKLPQKALEIMTEMSKQGQMAVPLAASSVERALCVIHVLAFNLLATPTRNACCVGNAVSKSQWVTTTCIWQVSSQASSLGIHYWGPLEAQGILMGHMRFGSRCCMTE